MVSAAVASIFMVSACFVTYLWFQLGFLHFLLVSATAATIFNDSRLGCYVFIVSGRVATYFWYPLRMLCFFYWFPLRWIRIY